MSKFDLNIPADFSRLTQQSLGEIEYLIDGREARLWDMEEGSYNGVKFHVFQSKVEWEGALSRVNDVAGRRKVKYRFPYVDGQTTDDLGRKPGSFTVDVLIFGPRYMRGFTALMTEFDKPTPGELVHPIRGKITVAVEDVDIVYSNESRKAVALNVTFIEHNFTLGMNWDKFVDNSVKGKLSAALEVFKKIDQATTTVENSALFARAVKNRINSYLNILKANNGSVLTEMNTTFNGGLSSSDIPSLLPVNQGGTRNSNGTTSTDDFQTVRSVSDPFNSVPVEEMSSEASQAIAAVQIKKNVENLRDQTEAIIAEINANGGALDMFDNIIALRETVILVQDAFEAGVASSNSRIIDYETPRLMSVREVAFANGLEVSRANEIDLLNPELDSVNYIAAGTLVKVPVS